MTIKALNLGSITHNPYIRISMMDCLLWASTQVPFNGILVGELDPVQSLFAVLLLSGYTFHDSPELSDVELENLIIDHGVEADYQSVSVQNCGVDHATIVVQWISHHNENHYDVIHELQALLDFAPELQPKVTIRDVNGWFEGETEWNSITWDVYPLEALDNKTPFVFLSC